MGAKAYERDWWDDLLRDAMCAADEAERPLAFEPECVLPAQWAAERPVSSLELLMVAVMWQAVYDFQMPKAARRRTAPQHGEWSTAQVRREAHRFFFAPSLPVPPGHTRCLDLPRICEHFEWDIAAIRRAVDAGARRVTHRRRPRGWGGKTALRRVVVT